MSRKDAREHLASLFAGQGFTTVYAHAPLDLRGASKVLAIYTDNSRRDRMSKHLINDLYRLFLDVYVKRVQGESAEDTLDTLHEAILTVTEANPTSAYWSHLELDEESDAFFAEVSGIPYRVERHSVTLTVTS